MNAPWRRVPSEFLAEDQEERVTGQEAEKLAVWLCQRLGIKLHRLTRRLGGGGGFKSVIYFAETDKGSLVLRVPHRGTGWNARLVESPDYHCIAGEYALTSLAALGQPVPELLAIERDCEVVGGPFAVFRRIAGIHMSDYCEKWSRWPYPEEQWGEFLRACHSIEPIRGAGPVNDEGIGLCASWSEFISRLLFARAAEYRNLLPTDFAARWERLLEHYAVLLDACPVRLLQMESNGYCNLILDPDTRRIKAVLDFEEVTAGDPLFELVIMGWYLGRRGIADHSGRTCFNWRRFYLGYGRVNWSHPLVPVYRTIILLEKLCREDRQSRARRLPTILRKLENAVRSGERFSLRG